MSDSITAPSASPFLFCADPEASMSFLTKAFGLERVTLEDGHGYARIGETLVFLSEPHPDGLVPANQLPSLHALVMVYLPSPSDVDALADRARGAGARVDYEPQDMAYGQRECGIRDLDGNLWCFAALLGQTSSPSRAQTSGQTQPSSQTRS